MPLNPIPPVVGQQSTVATPDRPRLVLRIGFAGNQELSQDAPTVGAGLREVFEILAHCLRGVSSDYVAKPQEAMNQVKRFFSKEKPLLRLVTGLCQGADALAATTFHQLRDHAEIGANISTELAAVIPFDLSTYRASRPEGFHKEFDIQAARCAYIMTLDGIYDKPKMDTPEAKNRRRRAYRAQSKLLLRHVDLLVAVTDPNVEGRAGGTLESLRTALELGLAVVLVHQKTGEIRFLQPGDDPLANASGTISGSSNWAAALRDRIDRILAGPDIVAEQPGPTHDYGIHFLQEYFDRPEFPPGTRNNAGELKRITGFGELCWDALKKRSEPPGDRPKSDPGLSPYDRYRRRSTELNYHYAGNYRGAFLLNYALAACAVALAALSLVLLGNAKHTDLGERLEVIVNHANSLQSSATTDDDTTSNNAESPNLIGNLAPTQKNQAPTTIKESPDGKPSAAASGSGSTPWLFLILLLLGVLKLSMVYWIARNTHRANHGLWNDKAVNFRYLAERLRTMFYLPRIGSFHPPALSPPQYASRAIRQSAVDWLLDAIVRSVSPASLDYAKTELVAVDGMQCAVKILSPDPQQLLEDVKKCWIWEQSVYHDRNARTMDRIHKFAETWGRILNIAVIVFVAFDISILVGTLAHWFPHRWEQELHRFTPYLVFLAALLPAVVASLNGIRFQSECRRLADRSAVMRAILRGHDPVVAETSQGRWRTWLQQSRVLFLIKEKNPPRISPPADRNGRWAEVQRVLDRINISKSNRSTDVGSWTSEALRAVEMVAEDFSQEVTEWSVLYAKEVVEP